jgi:antitoxin CptB
MIDDRERDRLRWRCRRGMLELDLLFQKFLDSEFSQLTERELSALQQLLDMQDTELLEYCYHRARPDNPELAALVRKIAG